MVIWDVMSASVLSRLEDVSAANTVLKEYKGDGSIHGLAWVLHAPSVLAVLVAPALLLLWDTKSTLVA